MRAFLVDDEPLARGYLAELLEAQGVTVVGTADNAAAAIAQVGTLEPDVVFLDIQMPGISGLEAAPEILRLPHAPIVVVVTGYAEHAVAAFEHETTDYLLKPVSPERLLRCLGKVRRILASKGGAATSSGRIAVRGDTGIRIVSTDEIVCASAREKKVFVRTDDGIEFRYMGSLSELESKCQSCGFVRIHDSYLVPLAKIRELIPLGNHEFEVRLSDGRRAPVGRTRYTALRERLGV